MKKILSHIINDGAAAVIGTLLLRVVFKALSANPLALVVSFIYTIGDVLTRPVDYIFPNLLIAGIEVDIIAITAMVFYGAIYLLLVKIVKTITGD